MPKDPSVYPNEEKLLTDLEYRKKRLEYAIAQEQQEFKALPGTPEEKEKGLDQLNSHHKAALWHLDKKHREIIETYRLKLKQEKISDKGLR